MHGDSILTTIFLVFGGAAVLATLAISLRQALIVAYLLVGAILGPWGMGWVTDPELIQDIARTGIIFLLFLLGLDLSPQKLLQLFRETTSVTILSMLMFASLAGVVGWLFGVGLADMLVIGICAAFSSTIVGLRLLPTTVLHHRHTGEVIISILLLQDLIAILVILILNGIGNGEVPFAEVLRTLISLPLLGLVAWAGHRFIILYLFRKFDRIQEYVFVLSIGWCLALAQLAHSAGLSYEIGAFVAGVAIATSPMALHIAESFKPIRDFFLIMFFFGLGAGFDISAAREVILPAAIIALGLLVLKPVTFHYLLARQSEPGTLSREIGVRLGQMSEFSLLIVFVAQQNRIIASETFHIVQLATIISLILSVYHIVAKYPTPVSLNDDLRRD